MTEEESLPRRLIVVLGLPCSGKSRFIQRTFGSEQFVWLAVDRVARRLPEYKSITAVSTYEEAAASAPLIVIETVGRTQQELLRVALCARHFGYATEFIWIRLPIIKSAKRAVARLRNAEEGLFIDPAYIVDDLRLMPAHGLIGSGVFDRWSIWDAGKNPEDEPVFVRAGVTRIANPGPYLMNNGIDWAKAWEVSLARAAEEVLARSTSETPFSS